MMRRSFLTLMGLAPVAGPAIASMEAATTAPSGPVFSSGPAVAAPSFAVPEAGAASPWAAMRRGELIVHGYRAGLISRDELRKAARDLVHIPDERRRGLFYQIEAMKSLSKAAKNRALETWLDDVAEAELLAGNDDKPSIVWQVSDKLLGILQK
jgi:hypothetical protein